MWETAVRPLADALTPRSRTQRDGGVPDRDFFLERREGDEREGGREEVNKYACGMCHTQHENRIEKRKSSHKTLFDRKKK